jgi:hypothetical protein
MTKATCLSMSARPLLASHSGPTAWRSRREPDSPAVARRSLAVQTSIIALFLFGIMKSTDSSLGADPQAWPHMPYVYMQPEPRHADSNRMFQGVPSIEVAPKGRLWATWYGGGEGEGPDNYVLLATSGDGGSTWSKPKIVIDPPFRASEPALWLDPRGRLWFMWNLYPIRPSHCQLEDYRRRFSDTASYNQFVKDYSCVAQQLWVMTADNPDDENPQWSEPRLIAMENINMNKPTVLSTGAWLWPTAPLSPLLKQ